MTISKRMAAALMAGDQYRNGGGRAHGLIAADAGEDEKGPQQAGDQRPPLHAQGQLLKAGDALAQQ